MSEERIIKLIEGPFPMTVGDCLRLGGHWYVQEPAYINMADKVYHFRTCRLCGDRQIGVSQPNVAWGVIGPNHPDYHFLITFGDPTVVRQDLRPGVVPSDKRNIQ
jgi:hypothetical protein